jgi:hypothetical protein
MVWQNAPAWPLYAHKATPEFDDPVQGSVCNNCSVIAAMTSCAWVNPANISGNFLANNKIRFYNPSKDQGFPATVWSPTQETCRSLENELWPGYYEKGYSNLVYGNPDATDPNILGTNWGNLSTAPLNRLTSMTGPGAQVTPADFYAFLANGNLYTAYAYPPAAAPLTGTSMQVKFPFIALTAGHTYSVLGTYTTTGGVKYIILRDPKGPAGGVPGGRTLADGSWWVNWAAFTPQGARTPSLPAWTQVNLANGVFGIRNEDFKTYFGQYGYVKG